mgnify:CR=1 FL=1|jgi:hypothetical protein|tara:strand:- start:17814 stop:18215 length:402 start_codon:yes stop_codon:yes gene_type:complete
MNPKQIGEISEGMILGRLLLAGKTVLQPFGDNQRYDLVIDEDGTFVRVQCKAGHVHNGVVRFNTCSTDRTTGKAKGYAGQADVFAVFCALLNKMYLVPVEDVPNTRAHLRLVEPKNGQSKGIRLASTYEFPPM